jgi:mono/diheme cytochrome c family protein
MTPAPASTGANNATGNARGAEIYAQICVACHMADGKGVPGTQAPLAGSAIVTGNPATVIQVLLRGPADVLPANRQKYGVVMPPFGATLNDADLASVLTFVRSSFGNSAPAITAAQVAAGRQNKK